MSTIQLRLISSITQLPNQEFMHLYLQMILLANKYVTIINNEYLDVIVESLQNQAERVKQLDVKLNAASEAVKKRNEVHKDIKNSIRYLKIRLESDLLSPSVKDREKANYITTRLAGLLDKKRITSVSQTPHTIQIIEHTIETDTNLGNALMDLGLMTRTEILFKQGEKFMQLHLQRFDNKATPAINKKAVRKEATNMLRLFFTTIEVCHSDTEEDVWVEMAEEVRELVGEATSKA